MGSFGSDRGGRERSAGSKNSEGVELSSPTGKALVPRRQCKYPSLGSGHNRHCGKCVGKTVNKAPPFQLEDRKTEATENSKLVGRSQRGKN